MKIIYSKLLLFVIGAITIASCEDDSTITTMNDSAETGPAQLSATNLVLQKESEDEVALTVNFLEPDFGYNSGSIGYQLLFDLEDGDFSNPELIDAGNSYSIDLSHADLNAVALSLGAEPDVEVSLKVMVETVLSTDSSLYSDSTSLAVTPYSTLVASIWGLVGSATVNGWDGPDMPLYKTSTPNIFVAEVTLADGDIKIRSNNDWAVNYGDNEPDGVLDLGGNNIAVAAGTYTVTLDFTDSNNPTYTIE